MKEQIKAPKKNTTKRWGDIQPIRYRVQNTVNRMLKEMVEYGHKIEERAKAMKTELKENAQGTNSEGKNAKIQINNLEQKEEINIQPE